MVPSTLVRTASTAVLSTVAVFTGKNWERMSDRIHWPHVSQAWQQYVSEENRVASSRVLRVGMGGCLS